MVPWLQIRHTGDKLLPRKPVVNTLKGNPNYNILLWSWRFMSITVWRWNVHVLKLCPNAVFRSRTFWEMIESLGSWTNSPTNQWRDEWWLHYQVDYGKVRETGNFIYSEEVSHWEPTHLSCLWPFSLPLSASQISWIQQLSLLYASVSMAFYLYHQPTRDK